MERAEIASFLHEPMRMAQVASVGSSGAPLLGSLWFLFADGRFWFNSHPTSPLVRAMERGRQVAVIVDEFTPPDHIRQVRIRGTGRAEAYDAARVYDIYSRYLGTDQNTWPSFFRDRVTDPGWTLWSVEPASGVATSNPDFRPLEVRWSTSIESPL